MKIVKLNEKKDNAYSSIINSFNGLGEITVFSNLDACGCTGNGNC